MCVYRVPACQRGWDACAHSDLVWIHRLAFGQGSNLKNEMQSQSIPPLVCFVSLASKVAGIRSADNTEAAGGWAQKKEMEEDMQWSWSQCLFCVMGVEHVRHRAGQGSSLFDRKARGGI